LIKWHTVFVTTDFRARRSPERPVFLCGVVPTLRGNTRWTVFLPGTAGILPAFPSTSVSLTSRFTRTNIYAGKMPAVPGRNTFRRASICAATIATEYLCAECTKRNIS